MAVNTIMTYNILHHIVTVHVVNYMNKRISVGDFNGNKYTKFMLGSDSRGRIDTLNTNNSS